MLARRAGEAESLVKKLRTDSTRLESDKERLQVRVQALEADAASVDASRNVSMEEANSALASAERALDEQVTATTRSIQMCAWAELLESNERGAP